MSVLAEFFFLFSSRIERWEEGRGGEGWESDAGWLRLGAELSAHLQLRQAEKVGAEPQQQEQQQHSARCATEGRDGE